MSRDANGYIKLAELIPDTARKLLDLGCGTGLELGRIFQRFPDISVTGVDLSSEMLKIEGKVSRQGYYPD